MTATDGFEKITQLINQGCDKVVVRNGSHNYTLVYDGTEIKSSHLLIMKKDLLLATGQLCVAHKTRSAVVLKVVDTPIVGDMFVMSISRHGQTIVINVKERADG